MYCPSVRGNVASFADLFIDLLDTQRLLPLFSITIAIRLLYYSDFLVAATDV